MIQVKWFSNLPSNQQEDFKQLVLSSSKLLDRLKEICYTTIQNGELTKQVDYDCPSWAYKQADLNGYMRAYREIADLADINNADKARK